VLLVDENPNAGGSGCYARGGATATLEKTAALLAAVRADSRIRLLTSTYAAGYYADHWVALVAPEYLVKVRARSVVIAQGAYEQPAVFRGNDLPAWCSRAPRSACSTDTPSRARSAWPF